MNQETKHKEIRYLFMGQISTNQFKPGLKIEVDGNPYTITVNEFVKPGKGQAFNRVKLKHLTSGRTMEKTFKSGEKFEEADVFETQMRMLYKEGDMVVLMDDTSYEQTEVPVENLGDTEKWLLEDTLYTVIFYKGEAVTVAPPTFMDLKIVETAPGARGDTASGRVLKPAITETGAEIQIPIFIDQDEVVKVDTRTGDYVARAAK
jgi:elongation factor P